MRYSNEAGVNQCFHCVLVAGWPPKPSNLKEPVPYSYLRDSSINDVFFRYVADYTYDWESWHDPLGKLVWVNRSVERMTGYTIEECWQMEDYPLPIVAAKDRPRIAKMLQQAIGQESYNDLEFEIVTRDGQPRWMAVSWQSIFNDQETHLGFRTSVRDITDRQGLKEQLTLYMEHLEQLVQERTARIAQLEKHRRQMEKLAALGELAAGVAHEVNNPLAGIRNAFALFRADLPADHKHFELLELVDKEIERISGIVHQMYQLYRHHPQAASEIVLEKLIRDVACLLEPIARRYQVQLAPIHPEDTGVAGGTTVTLPEGEVKQVLFNVVRNAIQASKPHGTVSIEYDFSNHWLEINVTDQGCGITDDALPHIFEPFYSTKSQLKEGMGLGLSVTRSLVESMSGTIDVETEVGSGTTFTILLPRCLS